MNRGDYNEDKAISFPSALFRLKEDNPDFYTSYLEI